MIEVKIDGNFLYECVFGSPPKARNVFRYNGTDTIKRESVAEHSYGVAVIAGVLTKKILSQGKFSINEALVYEMALFHDYEELYAGDIPAPFKINNPAFADKYDMACQSYLVNLSLQSDDEARHFMNIPYMDSIERRIVKIADILQLISYCYTELRMGNSLIKDVLKNGIAIYRKIYGDFSFALLPITIELDRIEGEI
jgi:5'-deoxynucleotidase YfbR-like HD superfamily hydrolase